MMTVKPSDQKSWCRFWCRLRVDAAPERNSGRSLLAASAFSVE